MKEKYHEKDKYMKGKIRGIMLLATLYNMVIVFNDSTKKKIKS